MTYRELRRMIEPIYGKEEARAVTDYVLEVYFRTVTRRRNVRCGGGNDGRSRGRTPQDIRPFA